MGAFEIEPFDRGTNAVAQAAAELTQAGRLQHGRRRRRHGGGPGPCRRARAVLLRLDRRRRLPGVAGGQGAAGRRGAGAALSEPLTVRVHDLRPGPRGARAGVRGRDVTLVTASGSRRVRRGRLLARGRARAGSPGGDRLRRRCRPRHGGAARGRARPAVHAARRRSPTSSPAWPGSWVAGCDATWPVGS